MLNNTLYKLTHKKKLSIGFFGGSLTEGAGSSDHGTKSNRAIILKWFRETYPDCEIREIYAAIGGTGTGYGMFRVGRDLISKGPDLVFMEYAVNDWGDSYENVLPQAESIFRQLRRETPECDVIAVLNTYTDIAKSVERGEEFESKSAQLTAAHYYGVPTVDSGSALHAYILRHGGNFDEFIPDTLHPTDEGHAVIASCIIEHLSALLGKSEAALAPHALPEPICPGVLDRAGMFHVSELPGLKCDGFEVKNEDICPDRFATCLYADKKGDSFTFTFEGRGIGLRWGDGFMSGNVYVQIDGHEKILMKTWDHHIRSFHRLRAALVPLDLEYGKHTVCVTSDSADPVKLSAIFVW